MEPLARQSVISEMLQQDGIRNGIKMELEKRSGVESDKKSEMKSGMESEKKPGMESEMESVTGSVMKEMMMQAQRDLVRNYRELNQTAIKGKTVLAGSSLMENFRVNELLMSRGIHKIVYNRGIGGMTVREYDQVLDVCVLDLEPEKLILNIGSNDLNLPGDTVANLMAGYRPLLKRIQRCLPDCRITLLAYYPCRKEKGTAPMIPGRITRSMDTILEANEQVRLLAEECVVEFRDLNEAVSDPEGYLDPEIAMDDIHFSQAGYIKLLDLLEPIL